MFHQIVTHPIISLIVFFVVIALVLLLVTKPESFDDSKH